MSRRVVITGMGIVSPIGNTVSDFFESLKSAKLGFSPFKGVVDENFEVKLVGSVNDFDPERRIDKKEAKRMDRFTQFAVTAALDAIEDSGSKFEDIDPFRAGVICGVGIGGLDLTGGEYNKYSEK